VRDLKAVPDQEAGVAGEFVFGLGMIWTTSSSATNSPPGMTALSHPSASSSSRTTLRASGAFADCSASRDSACDSLTSERTSS
jgi:hypothetical protein